MSKVTRREFFHKGALAAGAVALTATTAGVTRRLTRRETPSANPFAYPANHPSTKDSQWLHYEEVARFSCKRAEARRIACDSAGRLYLSAGKYISITDAAGNVANEIALPETGRCVAPAPDGLIHVALRDHIEVFDHRGQRKERWDSINARTWLTGLAVGENEVYAADAGNRVVLRYDRSGKLLKRIGERDPERNVPGFIVPSPFFDVELASDGLLRVTNPGHHRIEAYTREGDLEFAWGETSSRLEGFCGCCNPVNLALLPDGRCVTCEKGVPRVKVYSANGTLESLVAGPESFVENARACEDDDCTKGGLDVAVDATGRLYILDLALNQVRVMQRKAQAA